MTVEPRVKEVEREEETGFDERLWAFVKACQQSARVVMRRDALYGRHMSASRRPWTKLCPHHTYFFLTPYLFSSNRPLIDFDENAYCILPSLTVVDHPESVGHRAGTLRCQVVNAILLINETISYIRCPVQRTDHNASRQETCLLPKVL